MKRKWLSILLLAVLFFAYSCQNDTLQSDVRFKTDIVSKNHPSGKVYVHAPDSLLLTISRHDNSSIGSYQFRYEILEGSGELLIDNEKLLPDEGRTLNSTSFIGLYFPVCPGEQRLKFIFSNSEFRTETIYAISADLHSIQIRPQNTPKIILGIPSALSLDLDANELDATSFDVDFDVEGEGDICFVNPAIDSTGNIIPDQTQPYKLIRGRNNIYYLARNTGKHKIHLNIHNQYGYTREYDIHFKALLPDYQVEARIDTAITLGGKGELELTITPENPANDENYYMNYRYTGNKGKLSAESYDIPENTDIALKKGRYKYTFTPETEGKVGIEFTVKDENNSIKKGILEFEVINTETKINTGDTEKYLYSGQESKFTFSVNRKNYDGTFKCSISTIPANAGIFKINGHSHTNGEKTLIDKNSTLLSFTPLTCGNIIIRLSVYDEKDNITSKEINFNVSEAENKIEVSGYSPIVNTHSLSEFNLDIKETGYTGNYTCTINTIPGNAASIKVNGKDYSPRMAIQAEGNRISFTPLVSGDIVFCLETVSQAGNTQKKELAFTSVNTPLTVKMAGFQKEIIAGNSSSFSLIVSKPGYTGNFTCSTLQESGNGILRINGITSLPGVPVLISSNSSIPVSFTPSKTGELKLSFKISDGIEENEYPVTFFVSNPEIKMDVTGYAPEININTGTNFNITLSKSGSSGVYNCELSTIPEHAGTLKVNGQTYTTPVSINNTANLGFIPITTGNITLKAKITDIFGGQLEQDFKFNVEKPELQFRYLSSLEDNINPESGSSFNFAIQKPGYTGKYSLEISGSGYKSVKVDNSTYTGRQHLQTPGNTNIRFLPSSFAPVRLRLSITDENGDKIEKELSFTVNNTDINLSIDNPVTSLVTGRPVNFSFKATKPGYNGKFRYIANISPENSGQLSINGTSYTGNENEMSSNEVIPVIYTPLKPGTTTVQIIVRTTEGEEKSKTFSYTSTNPDINADIRSFTPTATIRTTNTCYLTVNCPDYTGNFKYGIKTIPSDAGQFIVAGKKYTGGATTLETPENCKFSFIPGTSGKVTAIVTISNDLGDKTEQILEYIVNNPELSITVNEIPGILPVEQESHLAFIPSKQNYTGKYFCELAGEGCSGLKINGKAYTGKTEINSGSNILAFIPQAAGKDAIRIMLKITDEWGGTTQKELTASGLAPETELSITNSGNTSLYPGESGEFIFSLTEGSSILKYEISLSPAGAGTITVNGKPYSGSPQETNSGTPVHVGFTPSLWREGNIILSIKGRGKYNQVEKSISYTVNNPPITISVPDFSGTSTLNTPNNCNININKEGYNGLYGYSLTVIPANAGKIRINGETYTNGEIKHPTGAKIEFTPSIVGEATLNLTVTDEWGMSTQKSLVYKTVNSDLSLSVSKYAGSIKTGETLPLNINITKAGYTGKLFLSATGGNIGKLLVNGILSPLNTKTAIRQGDNTLLLTPTAPGETNVDIVITDEWGGEKGYQVTFTVTPLETVLSLDTPEKTDLLVGQASDFTFTATGQDTLDVSFSISPDNAGKIAISGKTVQALRIASGQQTRATYTPSIKGEALVRIKANSQYNSAEKTIRYNITDPEIIIALPGFSGTSVLNTPNTSTLKVNKAGYIGEFRYMITTIPVQAGEIKINGKLYNGGKNLLATPELSTMEFTPAIAGNISVKITVEDNVGNTQEKILAFTSVNPPLVISVSDPSGLLVLNKPSQIEFTATKTNYTGKVFCEVTGENIKDLFLDGLSCPENIKMEIGQGSHKIKFTPTHPGQDNIKLRIKITDEWGGVQEREMVLSCANTNLNINLIPGKTDIVVGTESNFIFTPEKEQDKSDLLSYRLSVIPSDAGYFKIKGITYDGTPAVIAPGTAINVIFVPLLAGNATVKIAVEDKYGAKAEKTTIYKITKTIFPLTLSLGDYPKEITNQEEINLTATIQETDYSGTFTCAVACTHSNAPDAPGTLIVNGTTYKGEPLLIPNQGGTGEIQVCFKPNPSKTGTASVTLDISDANNQTVRKSIGFNIIEKINPLQLVTSNLPTGRLLIGNRAKFNLTAQKENSSGEKYSFQLSGFGVQDFRVDGEDCSYLKWYESGLQNAEISFIPNEFLNDIYLTVKVKDAAGNTVTKNIPFPKPGWEYAGIPCTLNFKRENFNTGTYDFSTRFEYYNYVMEEDRQVDIGHVNKLQLLPGEANEKTQALSPVRIFKMADGRCRCQITTQDFEFRWSESPDNVKATFFLDVISGQGELLYHQEHKMIPGLICNGEGKISFGGSFEETFLPDYEEIKKSHIIIGFIIK